MKALLKIALAAMIIGAPMTPSVAEEMKNKPVQKNAAGSEVVAREVMEAALVQFWNFFKEGDVDRSGYIEKNELFAHPIYELSKWNKSQITFVLWMVDDNKDGKVSLQEWFNNELGQFQLGDKNHDGIIDQKEYDDLVMIQERLFEDLNFPAQK